MSLTLKQLQWFCAQASDEREFLRKPFRRGAFVYATNGHIGVRVLGDGIKADEIPPDKLPSLEVLFDRPPPSALVDFPTVPLAAKCVSCKGKRTVRLGSCEDCNGDGTFFHGQHEYDCKHCDGDGWTDDYSDGATVEDRPCGNCNGLGRIGARHVVAAAGFQQVYLNWIARLPGPVLFAAGGPEDSAAFAFDGGNGVLMPMRT